MRFVPLWSLMSATLLVACSTTSGPISAPPTPTSGHPVKVSLHRVESLEGAAVPMVFTIDGTEVYGLRNGETYRFELDPGQYVFGWDFGFNTCEQDVWLRSGRDIDLTLSNDCDIPPEP